MLTIYRRCLVGFVWLVLSGLAISSCGARSELPYPELDVCVSFEATAEQTQVDLFILLDSSGSMEFAIEEGKNISKWSEVVSALSSFLVDPGLSGSGAGIAFFPRVRPEVPNFCYSDDTCGDPDSCAPFGLCWPSGDAPCQTQQHCVDADLPDDVCEPLGLCQDNPDMICLINDPQTCGDAPCLEGGYCTNTASCDPTSYAVEEVVALPIGAPTLITAMSTRSLEGSTPTLPALEGVIDSAADWSQQSAHKTIVVLATDGLPTTCDPSLDSFDTNGAIGEVPEAAADGLVRGVQTFVIGVFAQVEEDVAQVNLDLVAAAGGSGEAFIVTTNESLQDEFLAALESVRAKAGRCVYTADWFGSTALSIAQVRVGLTLANGQQTVVDPRPNRDACHPVLGGFYFETMPTDGSSTVRIALCDTTCALLGDAPSPIDLLVSCE